MRRSRISALCLCVFCCLSLSACFPEGIDGLLQPPKQPIAYVQLQTQIDKLLEAGAVYAFPAAGSNRQVIQQADIDGDGVEESLVFLQKNEDHPLRIYFYHKVEDTYVEAGVISGDGTSFDSVSYADLDGDKSMEILVGWRVSDSLRGMTVHTWVDGALHPMLTNTSYNAYSLQDFNKDGLPELMLVRSSATDIPGSAELYLPKGKDLVFSTTAPLSLGAGGVSRIRNGMLSDGNPAVFVASYYGDNGLITDVFAYRNGKITNLSLDPLTAASNETVRWYPIYATDLTGDGITDIPSPTKQLPFYDANISDNQFITTWSSYSLSGVAAQTALTYHNFNKGFYFDLPESWSEGLTIAQRIVTNDEQQLIFAQYNGPDTAPTDVLIVSILTGDGHSERADKEGRFVLGEKQNTVVAAKIPASAYDAQEKFRLKKEDVLAAFHWIIKEWIVGEMTQS